MKSQMEWKCFGKLVSRYNSLQINVLLVTVEGAYLPNLTQVWKSNTAQQPKKSFGNPSYFFQQHGFILIQKNHKPLF